MKIISTMLINEMYYSSYPHHHIYGVSVHTTDSKTTYSI